ncbi:MAG: DNA polymerase Y family protein [Alphaproteobacteria bacterium]|nr:DNA polymerase Y family protein [Alphaproteobacteria bacterium]
MQNHRRILSIWFPRLAAERVLRIERGTISGPLAIIATDNNTQTLASLSLEAEAEGLRVSQPLRDARAFCPGLLTRPASQQAEAAFLSRLARWASKFTPFIAQEPPAALLLDITGCAHLFGGEIPLTQALQADCAKLGLSVQTGIADTPGAAWALARFAGQSGHSAHTGDAIDQEARATRSRAAKRHWTRGGAAPHLSMNTSAPAIAEPGKIRQALAPLPIAALRLPAAAATNLNRLGIRRIDELTCLPRAALARRFGRDVVRRLDQALGVEPEPITPARPENIFATRLTLPDPIGLESDIMAAIDRLLPPLCERLKRAGKGARRIRLGLLRSDHTSQHIEAGLARPSHSPDQIRPLIALKLIEVDPGFGIDVIRIEAATVEPLHPTQHSGHAEASTAGASRLKDGAQMDNLITRLGGRIGLEAITRLHPADSHIPEKTATIMGAAWSGPDLNWRAPDNPRPLVLFPPEIVTSENEPRPPITFRWRRRDFETTIAHGPERIAPEWWLDDPNWRSGLRDYWRLETATGERLWLFYAHGGAHVSGGWFCQGVFA